MTMELFDHQKEGIQFIKDHKKVYLAFDMGIGKTLTSVAAAEELSEKKTLIIAEKNEIVNSKNFAKEVENYCPDSGYSSLRDTPLGESKKFCGINPDMLLKIPVKEINDNFGFVIVDEATLAKQVKTKRFKALKKICQGIDYLTLLSGTPMMNGASEMYAPLLLLGSKVAGNGTKESQMAFEKIFAGGFYKQVRSTKDLKPEYIKKNFWKFYQWWAKGANNLRELRYLISDQFIFKRKEDTNNFKKKDRRIEPVEMSVEWRIEYDRAWDDYFDKARIRLRGEDDIEKRLSNISELRKVIENGQVYQVNSRWKSKIIAKDIAEKKYGDEKIVVFTLYIESGKILMDELDRLGVSYRFFDEQDEWKVGPEQVLIGRIRANAKGSNLPEASVVLFADMDFVPANNIQAENRIDRPEQKKDMTVRYYMVTEKGSIDVHVQKIVKDKMRKIDEFMRPFTEEELKGMPERIKALERKYPAECRKLWIRS